ncbi:MAG: hypothetical protein WC890_04270 [Candidatus Margulisiibacteriota bacterium]
MAKKLRIRFSNDPALIITRNAVKDSKLCYIACTNKKIKYPWGTSRIVYIGTTKKGANRLATSAAFRAPEILKRHGLKDCRFYAITCTCRQGLESWKKLEKDLILSFKSRYGAIPSCNKQHVNTHPSKQSGLFGYQQLEKTIQNFT